MMFPVKSSANIRGLERSVHKRRKFDHTIASHFHEVRVQFVQYMTRGFPLTRYSRTPHKYTETT